MAGQTEELDSAQINADGQDRRASDSILKALYHERLLNPAAFFRAREMIFPQRHWILWIRRILLITGTALALAGVIFFFAYNWGDLPPFAKFGLIEACMLGCVIGAWFCKLESPLGNAFSMAAGILVGVFLAVFGQVYPTGADAYNLFGGWALLITAWVFIARAPALLFLWMILLNLTVWTYWDQGRTWWIGWDETAVMLSHAGLNAAFVIFVEAGARWKWTWLNTRWLRGILLMAVFSALVYPIEDVVFSWRMTWPLETLAASAAAVAATFYFYRYRKPDLFALAVAMMFVCVVLSSIPIRVFIVSRFFRDTPEAIAVLFTGMCIVGIFAVAVFVLRTMSRSMPAEASEDHIADSAPESPGGSGNAARPERPTLRVLLDNLQAENRIDVIERAAINTALFKSKNEKPTPWYLHAMVGFGAWLAGLCFFGFVMLLMGESTFRETGKAITIGLVWLGMAIFMSRTWEAIFFSQLALAMSGAGHLMILMGVSEAMGYREGEYTLALVACVMCAVLNPLYRTATHRFLSTSLALILIFEAVHRGSGLNVVLTAVLALEAVAVGILFTHPKSPSNLRPVGFAMALALPITFHMLTYHVFPLHLWWSQEYTWWPVNIVMVLLISALIAYLTSENAIALKMRPWLILCAAVLGILGGVGLLVGIALMILGHARREREIAGLGVASLASFLFFYYYNMDTDLLLKSIILGGSGAILLLVRALISRHMPAKEASC